MSLARTDGKNRTRQQGRCVKFGCLKTSNWKAEWPWTGPQLPSLLYGTHAG